MKQSCSHRGFTLVEVLVTLAIMSLVMLALQYSLQSTMLTHDNVAIEIASVREGPKILDMIERDLRGLHCYNMKQTSILRGKEESHLGARGDRIDFITEVNSATRIKDPESPESARRMVATDINEVGYRLRPNPQMDDFLELYRREDLFVDDEPFEGGRYELVHNRVVRFQVSYVDQLGEEGEEEDEWDLEDRQVLPAAIKIYMELQSSPDLVGGFADSQVLAQRVHTYTRVIPLLPEYGDTLRIRPVIPTEIVAGEVGGGGGGATGGEGDGAGPGTGPGGPGGPVPGMLSPDRPKFEVGNLPDPGVRGGRGNIGINFGGDTSGADLGLNPSEQEILELFLNEYRDRYGSGDDPDDLFGDGGGGR